MDPKVDNLMAWLEKVTESQFTDEEREKVRGQMTDFVALMKEALKD